MQRSASRAIVVPMLLLAAVCVAASVLLSALAQPQSAAGCRPGSLLARVADLPELSGLAVSRRTPGRLWAHNDSGEPELVALDTQGRAVGRIRVSGATVEDWEAIAVGPCPSGSCIYIGDIGDNDAARKRVTIYRVPEPDNPNGSLAAGDVFHGAYPDGAHDTEALLIAADGRLHVVTKGETGPVALYRFPADVRKGATLQLERVGTPLAGKGEKNTRITDGAVSPDGQWTALRTASSVVFYRSADIFAGRWNEVARVDLGALDEPQGEAISLGADNTVFIAGEGGGKGQAGTFARFTCAPQG